MGGAKNDAKLEINFETRKSFRRFFSNFFFEDPLEKKHPGAALPLLARNLATPSGAIAAVAAGPPSQKRVQSYTLLLKLPNFLPKKFSKTMFFSMFFRISPLTSPLQGVKCRCRYHTITRRQTQNNRKTSPH